MSENNDNFLLNFLKLSKGTEIPEIFAVWCAVSAVSCSLGLRVFLDMGPYCIFPNFYTILVAPSGRFRKSSSIRLASDLLKQLVPRPNLISQKITPEALIEAMNNNAGKQNLLAATDCTGFLVVDELATFLNRKSYEAGLGSVLIELYDCPVDFEYRTKGRGVERLELPCLGLLSASTVDWIRDAIPAEAVGGGLTSRCLFVYAETPPPPVARTTFAQDKADLREGLIRSLQSLLTLQGPARLTDEAWKVYEVEYMRFHEGARDLWEDKYLTGYAARRHVHWLKLSMIFAASEGTLTIQERHLAGALRMLQHAEKHMKMVMSLITASEMGGNIARVETIIQRSKRISKTAIVRSMVNVLSARQLGEVLDTLVAGGSVQVEVVGKELFYVYKP